jgi:hypothetical protein
MTANNQVDDFDIGKAVFEKLKDLPPERRERILRWVSEGLGVSIVTKPSAPLAGAVSPSITPTPTAGSVSDIKSFISVKAPKSDMQFAAAVAYFYRFEAQPSHRRDSINGTTLQEATRLTGRERLVKPRLTLNNAKAAGYLDSVSPGEFAINSVGENLVAMTLPGGGDVKSGTKRKPRTRKKKPSSTAKRLSS